MTSSKHKTNNKRPLQLPHFCGGGGGGGGGGGRDGGECTKICKQSLFGIKWLPIPLSMVLLASFFRIISVARFLPEIGFIMDHHNPNINSTPVIFYHISVQQNDDNDEQVEYQRNLVQQQLQQIRSTHPLAKVQYNLVLQNKKNNNQQRVWHELITQAFPEGCTSLKTTEDELHTLQNLWEHCQEYPSDIVTYIHNQDGHTDLPFTDGTQAALQCHSFIVAQHRQSFETKKRKQEPQQKVCTSCGLPFKLRPSYQHPTNQWTAPCSYVQKLIAPKDYPSRLQTMYRHLQRSEDLKCLRPHNITYANERMRSTILGLDDDPAENGDRYYKAWTARWIHSSPTLQPCDAISESAWTEMKDHHKHRQAMSYSSSVTTTKFPWELHLAPQTPEFEKLGALTSWQTLEGRLFEWDFINTKPKNKLDGDKNNDSNKDTIRNPPPQSWVYGFYAKAKKGVKCYKNYLSNEFW